MAGECSSASLAGSRPVVYHIGYLIGMKRHNVNLDWKI